jgi:hypothetical protein
MQVFLKNSTCHVDPETQNSGKEIVMTENDTNKADEVQDPAEQYELEKRVQVDEEQLVAHHPEDDDPLSLAGDEIEEDEN